LGWPSGDQIQSSEAFFNADLADLADLKKQFLF